MAGHSHFANIKRKKEINDHEKSKIFGKVTREIIVAISQGGGVTDPDANLALRGALEKAREVGLPKENTDRIIEKAKNRAQLMTEVVYEALGPSGVGFMIKTATDNPRRTHADLSIFIERNGGKVVEKGAVGYQFELCGVLRLENKSEQDALVATEALGGSDVEEYESGYLIYVPYTHLAEAWQQAKKLGISQAPELVYKPIVSISVAGFEAQKVLDLMEKIEDHDDVVALYTNAQFV